MNKKILVIAFAAVAFMSSSCGSKENTDPIPNPGGNTTTDYSIGGVAASEFSIVYALPGTTCDCWNIEKEIANELKTALFKSQKASISVKESGTSEKEHEILIGNTNRAASKQAYTENSDPFDYKISMSGGKLVISGGEWGVRHAANLLINDYINAGKAVPATISVSGNARGKQLFARTTRSNLRIFDDNIWQYDKTTVPDVWSAAGEDPRNSFRGVQFADIVAAFMPDVFGFQEYSSKMEAVFLPKIKNYGYSKCVESQTVNFTPIFYNPATVQLVKDGYWLFTPAQWSNSNTKSFTWAVFKLKASGYQFAVVCTHLWWKSESEQAGSNQARCEQVNVIRAKVAEIEKEYSCPVFVAGDMNCNLKSDAMKFFLNDSYEPCAQIATVSKDGSKGHHACAESGFAAPTTNTAADNGMSSIDQFFVHNKGTIAKVLTFKKVYADFTYPLTDHCPNYVDVALD